MAFHFHFHVGRSDEAVTLVERYHYSRRRPANIQVVGTWHSSGGLFGDSGEAIAACFFPIPPTRWSEPVLELSRLVRTDAVIMSLTGLIARTVRYILAQGMADLLVSFADASKGHHGGVYQAASWKYAGQRDRMMDGILLDGYFWPGRSCNSRWGTRSPAKLREIMPGRSIEPHYDTGKHLYWRSLNKEGIKRASRLGLGDFPYPKPDYANREIAA